MISQHNTEVAEIFSDSVILYMSSKLMESLTEHRLDLIKVKFMGKSGDTWYARIIEHSVSSRQPANITAFLINANTNNQHCKWSLREFAITQKIITCCTEIEVKSIVSRTPTVEEIRTALHVNTAPYLSI
jgi:hypothetical protein